MKHLPLVWAGLARKPVRSILTLLSVASAFVLFGLLQGINAGFDKAIAEAHLDFLITDTRVRGGAPMPIAAMEDIRRIPNVAQVAQRAYFIGYYREPKDGVGALATEPDRWITVRPGFTATPAHLAAMRATRTGMMATPALRKHFGWKIGDKVTLNSRTLKRDGGGAWTFDLVGEFESVQAPGRLHLALINYAYFDEARVENRGTADRFFIRIAEPRRAVETAAAIDRFFANSAHETRTRSDQERAQAQVKQMGDVAFFTNAIVAAVLFTLLFLTGNTMRQSVQDRLPEFAVLKTIGYTDARVFCIVMIEALALCLAAAALGLALAASAAPYLSQAFGDIHVSADVASLGVAAAALVAFLSASLPTWRLYRMRIADSLAGR